MFFSWVPLPSAAPRKEPAVDDHPTTEDFERFLQCSPRPSNPGNNAWVVRHLLQDCTICTLTFRELKQSRTVLSRLLEVALPSPDSEDVRPAKTYNYEWAFARTERVFHSFLAQRPAHELPERLSELASLPEGEQIRRVSLGGRFADPELIQRLMDRSHDARYQSPRKMLHLARLAHLASEACTTGAAGGDAVLADLQAQAWGALGNAQRICGNLPEAEQALNTAFQKYEQGTKSPPILAHLLTQMTSLRIYQRRFDEAIRFAEEAGRIYRESGNRHELSGTMVQKAIAILYSGEAESAADVLQRAIPLIDRDEDPYIFLAAHHNLARCYIDLDRPEETLALFVEAKPLYQECKDPLILLRATWQEGQLLREIGHLRNAKAALLHARQGFTEQGLAYETALVSLDLADVYDKLGMPDELRQTIAEAMPIFRSMRVGREVLASLLRLRQTAGLDSPGEESTGAAASLS
jgi:tetratricopeptide (TPR) repeat protein